MVLESSYMLLVTSGAEIAGPREFTYVVSN